MTNPLGAEVVVAEDRPEVAHVEEVEHDSVGVEPDFEEAELEPEGAVASLAAASVGDTEEHLLVQPTAH